MSEKDERELLEHLECKLAAFPRGPEVRYYQLSREELATLIGWGNAALLPRKEGVE